MKLSCSSLTGLWLKYGSRIRKFVRFVVLSACTVVVIIQLSECFTKLSSPPVSSHVHIVLNESMTYPAVTVCRYPSYKTDVLVKYNLQSNLRTTKDWEDFPFGEITLPELWKKATYGLDEVHKLSAVSSYPRNVKIESSFQLIWGQCHTFNALIQTTSSGKEKGYSIILYKKDASYNRTEGEPEEGWYVYVHPEANIWTESTMEGQEESIFLEVGEELHVKIVAEEYHLVDKAREHCNDSWDHSYDTCVHTCKTEQLVSEIGCSGPWLLHNGTEYCSEYTTLKNLISGYLYRFTCEDPCCNCIRPCHSFKFVPYVVKRKAMQSTEPNHTMSQLYLYYTSRRVQVSEEKLAYDWSLFLSDLGGSLGFLLGLSVLGIIGIMERLIDLLYGSFQPPGRSNTLILEHNKNNILKQLESNRNLDANEEMECACCKLTPGDKNFNLHSIETLRCKNKLTPQLHEVKY
ncbi:acid-sensing ion channel 1B [Periplaneta americana]|uniref:acid-sensing ion channel 1B n=1 Tax=Periplaneta americana TaxID=6978 RepID=UPI0037E93B9D